MTRTPRALIACESSGRVRDALRRRGWDAYSCDILPSRGPHLQTDVRNVLRDGWDLMIAHPPCTYLCSSGLHWNGRRPGRQALTDAALEFVRLLLEAPIPHIGLENPRGCIGSRIRRANQIIQPYEFGHDASKETHLWLQGLPTLQPTRYIAPRIVGGRKRWANQTDSGQNRLPPSADRWQLRAETYQGIADAMADQWGTWIELQLTA
jgi:hypothetical protein